MIFRHYGSDKFSKKLYNEIKNHNFLTKPFGGLWTSPLIGDTTAWKDWCDSEDFYIKDLSKYFDFTLKSDSKIITINSIEDIYSNFNHFILPGYITKLMKVYLNEEYIDDGMIYLDFENIKNKLNIDAIILNINKELYFKLYGWNVDSILILNHKIVKPITTGKIIL